MDTKDQPTNIPNHKDLLYQILPAIYRERDDSQHLKKYLNGIGLLLDQVHQTLLQRFADIFPYEDQVNDIKVQTWILPYIAALFDARIVSPTEQGQQQEIRNAISWRKRKGTITIIDQIAEAVGGMEVVVHEGWKRVATTPRIGKPLLPISAYGYEDIRSYSKHFKEYQRDRTKDFAPLWARHPGLPPGTVDLRCPGGAVAATPKNPAAVRSRFRDKYFHWRQSSLHGVPRCHADHSILPQADLVPDWIPGYFDDPSVRTVDIRNPNWRQGHYHPHRVLLYTATHAGFFPSVDYQFFWSNDLLHNEDFLSVVSVQTSGNRTIYRNRSLDIGPYRSIVIRRRVELGQVPSGTGPADQFSWRFEGFTFVHTIEADSGRLEFDRCAILSAKVHSTDTKEPVVTADNSLFNRLQAAKGLVRLQYCTVMATTIAEKLQASDSIFNGLIRKDRNVASLPGEGCVRYSAISPTQNSGNLSLKHHHKTKAIFYSQMFGQLGCGVLHPANSKNITNGAEDNGEIGAYHHLYLAARKQAVIDKLRDFLPTGMKAVVIPDNSLQQMSENIMTQNSDSTN